MPALLTDDGDLVTEGAAILQFIADSRGAASLAAAPGTLAHARAQEVLNFTSSELRTVFGPLFRPGLPDDLRAIHVAKVGCRFDWMEGLLADGRTPGHHCAGANSIRSQRLPNGSRNTATVP